MYPQLTGVEFFLRTLIKESDSHYRFYNTQYNQKLRSFRNVEELLIVKDQVQWYTPNQFNLVKCGRTKKNVQFINSVVVEFDCFLPSVLDVIERIEEAGIEPPHFLARSKTPGHWHVYWLIDPIPAYSNVVKQIERITKDMANRMGADIQGVGVERWFAIPRGDIYSYAPPTALYSYQTFKDWFEINTYENNQSIKKKETSAKVLKMDVFGHPAIIKLLQGSDVGQRDHACFTLALLFYSQGWSKSEALNELISWNKKNTEQIRISQINKCLKSAYSGKYKGPKPEYIEYLTGIPFKMRIMRVSQEERNYQKLYDIQYRILQLIRKEKVLSLSQADIAEEIKAPLRSVKKALKELIELKRIIKIGGGKGPGNNAAYKLSNDNWKEKNTTRNKTLKTNWINFEVEHSRPLVGAIGANRFTSFSTGPP